MTDINTPADDDVFALRIGPEDNLGQLIGRALQALRIQAAALHYQQQVLTTVLFERYADQTGVPAPVIPEGGKDVVAKIIAGIASTEHVGPPTDGTFTLTKDGVTDPVEYPLTWAGLTNVANEQTVEQELGFKPGPDGAYASIEAEIAAARAAAVFERTFGTPVGQA